MRTSDRNNPLRLFASALLSPFVRLDDAPTWGKMLGAVVALVKLAIGAPLTQLLLLLVAVSGLDYLLGAEVARQKGTYNPDVARAGALGKGVGATLCLIVWALEGVIASADLPSTGGALATALAVALLAVELESFDAHRERLTGKPTPLLRPILDFLRGIADGVFTRGRKGG